MPRSRRGRRRPRADSRDYVFRPSTLGIPTTVSKQKVTLDPGFPAFDQGRVVPCCVSASVTAGMEALDHYFDGESVRLSVLYHYYVSRVTVNRTSGKWKPDNYMRDLQMRTGLDAAVSFGVCRAVSHGSGVVLSGQPDVDKAAANARPAPRARREAESMRIARAQDTGWPEYYRIKKTPKTGAWIKLWRLALQAGFPVLLGFWTTKGYKSISPGSPRHGRPESLDRGKARHAVAVVGYNKNGLIIKDSQGQHFGCKGRWLLPYRYVSKSFIEEAWTIVRVTHG